METSRQYSMGFTLALIVLLQIIASLVLAIPVALIFRDALTAGSLLELVSGAVIFALSLLVSFAFLSSRITVFDKQELGSRLAIIYLAFGMLGLVVAGFTLSPVIQAIAYPVLAYGIAMIYPRVLPRSVCPTCRI